MNHEEEKKLIEKASINIEQAIEVLNRYHHGSDLPLHDEYKLPWKWARYRDPIPIEYISGVGITHNLGAEYAEDDDLGEYPQMLSDFAAIAIAEAYLRYGVGEAQKAKA